MGIVIYDKTGKYTGFLGNVMFQAASTIGIAMKNGMQFKFPHKDYFQLFKWQLPVMDCSGIQAIDYHEPNFHYDPITFNPEYNYNLNGYFQSCKYWDGLDDYIKGMFEFNDVIQQYVTDKYSIFHNENQLVGVHVRRGDYLNHPNHHPALSIEYYVESANHINNIIENPIYVIFSDDIPWCQMRFNNRKDVFKNIIFAENNTPAQDMHFMSRCHHQIIANSSFSWWSQYLNNNENKIVVAPTKDKWFGSAYANWNVDDLYQPHWILK